MFLERYRADYLRSAVAVVVVLSCLVTDAVEGKVVGAFVLPHGGIALDPARFNTTNQTALEQAWQIHNAARKVGHQINRLSPDLLFLSTPHGVADLTNFLFYLNPEAYGSADTDNCVCPPCCYNVSVDINSEMSETLVEKLKREGVMISGLSAFGPPGGADEPFPLRWAEVIPLHFIPHLNTTSVVVLSHPSRRYNHSVAMLPELLRLGKSLYKELEASKERVVVIVSADLAHTHSADGPYGFSPAAQPFDQACGEWASTLHPTPLLVNATSLVDDALSCGYTGLVMLHAILSTSSTWRPTLLVNHHPSYYGMMVASFLPELQPYVRWGAAGKTRRLVDFLERVGQRKESSEQVFMSQVGADGHLEVQVRARQPESDRLLVSPGSHEVRTGGVQGLHLSLAGVGQVRAMWMNPVPFTAPSDFKPQCAYTVLQSDSAVKKQPTNRQPLASIHRRWKVNNGHNDDKRPNVLKDGKAAPSVAVGRAYTYTAGNFNATLNEAVMKYEPGSVPVTINYQCGDVNYAMSPPYNFTIQPTTVQKRSDAEEPAQKKRMIKSFKNFSSETASKVLPGRTCADDTCVEGSERVGKVALIADMGVEEDSFTIRSILRQVDQDELDFVLHAGDISYADNFGTTYRSSDGNNSWVWVQYMTSLHDVTARVPYMTCPGNHEKQFDFAAYRNWLHMPWNESRSSSPYYFSFDYLGVHFVGISTEHDMRGNSSQHRWLEQDLRTADLNRARTPWILVFGHRPLYCSSAALWTTRCTTEAREYRSDIEELFVRYHVDVYVCGHNHQYERSWPVSGGNVTAKNYHNPAATVHIVTGAAGNPEGNDPSYVPEFLAPWRAGYSLTMKTGWTLMEVNSTALAFSYIHSADASGGKVVDRFTITKTP
ncbi:uncharacterized protein LOC144885921 isoform X2 [Branchiostoma floridae x Branchiostoma japonicum]